jgi:hypothetical protein
MPIAVVGLLSLLESSGAPAHAAWRDDEDSQDPLLAIETPLDPGELASLISAAPRPSLDGIQWPGGEYSQSLKPTLKKTDRPREALHAMTARASDLDARLLRSIVTDAVLDGDGIPSRNRLLWGVKADLSTAGTSPKESDPTHLQIEIETGPRFVGKTSGLGLGLVPEIQTFGGTTGRDASTVGAYSPLLYLLLSEGLMALPPIAVRRGWQRVVGGPLVTKPDVISWPRWHMPVGLAGLRSLLCWDEIHREKPEIQRLSPRGVEAVYRTRAVSLSKTVAVFRWGEQVAG